MKKTTGASAVDDRLFLQSVARALDVLEAFARSPRPKSLGEIAAATGVNKSAAQRIGQTLLARGYLERADSGGLTLGRRLLDRSFDYLRSNPLIETPIQNVCRQTMRRVEIDGVTVENDAKILIMLGAANRDPDQWERPDAFDVTRQTLGHLALGAGVHICIGQMIARLEGEAVLKAMLARVGSLSLEGAPTRTLNNNLRSLKTLPLAVTAD